MRRTLLLFWLGATMLPATAADLSPLINKVRPGVVAVATYQPSHNPPAKFRGTGFVVGDGRHIVTNAHVTPAFVDALSKEVLVVLVGRGREAKVRQVEKIAQDVDHDLALLRLKGGEPLPALRLADADTVQEGQEIAFTGFPLGTVLGLFPVTHRGMISVITPIVIPSATTRDLDARAIKSLRTPFEVYQLDATAYPGSSGSPVLDTNTGDVIGIINMVFVKGTKEKAITDPSGITYAIPVVHVHKLLQRAGAR